MTDKSEIEELKERADTMGIKYSPNIGVDALREKVNAKLNPEPVAKDDLSYKTNNAFRKSLMEDATKLIRIKLVCMNPNKKEISGEYFSFGNSAVGNITRFIPFDIETHVENALLNLIKERKFAKITLAKKADGTTYPERKLVSEFGIEILPALTAKELSDLAADQSKRGAIDN